MNLTCEKILLLIFAAGLLGSTGCVFWRGQDPADDHRSPAAHDEHSTGVDHGEYPGDMNHDANQ